MSRSRVLLLLASVVALSFTVPALAGKSSPLKLAKQALKLSKKADKRSKTALKTANTAKANAATALTKANTPVTDVAHATNADHSTSADKAAAVDGLTVLGRVRAQPTSGSDFATAQANAPEIPLFARGPLRVYGKCFSYTATYPDVEAHVYLATSQNGVMYASEDNGDSGNTYLNADTPEDNRDVMYQASSDNVGSVNAGSGKGQFWAVAPDGSVLQGEVYVGAKQGNPAVGDGPIGPGSGCLFTGRAFGS